MNKLKDVKIHDTLPTNMGGIRIETGLISKESVDAGTIDECVGIDSTNKPVRGAGAESETFTEEVEAVINDSLIDGELKTVLQNKTLSVSDFPLTSDIDTQHSDVNEGLLPNGNMESLTETQVNKIILTLNRIINKGWLKTGTSSCIRISSVMYSADAILVNATQILFGNATVKSGSSYRIFLDIANSLYEFEQGSYN